MKNVCVGMEGEQEGMLSCSYFPYTESGEIKAFFTCHPRKVNY